MQVSTTEAHAKARCPRYLSQRLLAKGINFEKKKNEKWRHRGEGGETDWCLFLDHDSLFFTGTKQRNKRKIMKEKFSFLCLIFQCFILFPRHNELPLLLSVTKCKFSS